MFINYTNVLITSKQTSLVDWEDAKERFQNPMFGQLCNHTKCRQFPEEISDSKINRKQGGFIQQWINKGNKSKDTLLIWLQ